jgi:hypothetical protein
MKKYEIKFMVHFLTYFIHHILKMKIDKIRIMAHFQPILFDA